jgi:catechol-2,3-dioxygenase
MVETYGLTHIALLVKVQRSVNFYQMIFGVKETYHHDDWSQVETPGCKDLIVFQQSDQKFDTISGFIHFGFRLKKPDEIEKITEELVEKAGGKILRRGQFTPDEPYVFLQDPDGYEVEVAFEPEHNS